MGYTWLVLSIAFLLAEIGTPGLFFFVSFAIGCITAAIAAFIGFSLIIQCVTAVIALCLSFYVMRRLFAKKTTTQTLKTNIEALAHKTGIVIKTIEPHKTGKVKVGGEIWTAQAEEAEHPRTIEKNTVITVVKIQGNRLIVK